MPTVLVPQQIAPATIAVGGVDIGFENPDRSGITWSTIDGWYSGPGSRTNFSDRVNDHGSFDAPVYRTSRVVTITGAAYADSRGQVAAMLHALLGVLAEGQIGDLTVFDPDFGDLTASVRLSDGPQIGWNDTALQWTWQVQFTAPDPHLYADEISKTTGLPSPPPDGLSFPLFDHTGMLEFGDPGDLGQVTLHNKGTADTFLTFAVAGPVVGGVVLTDVDSGRSIVYAGDVPSSGTLLIIDTAVGRALLNGSDRTGDLTQKQWWPVPAGGSSTVQFSTLGAVGQAGQLTASIRPAYW